MIDWTKVIITADDDTVSEASGQVILLASGVPGESASVEVVETVTLDPLEDADVENVGDSRNVRLKFKIPRGKSGVWGGIGGTLEDQADLKQALDAKADIIHTSASGSLVHITDAAAYPVDSLSVSIDPVQDLHGYDAPWPAGGGKNLLNIANSENGAINTSGQETINTENWRSTVFIPITAGETYTLSAKSSLGAVARLYWYDSNQDFISPRIEGALKVTATAPNNAAYAKWTFATASEFTQEIAEANDLQLEQGSTATSYAPYANVCPISGHTSATVTRTGKNLFDKTATDTTKGYKVNYYLNSSGEEVSFNGLAISEYLSAKPSITYTLSDIGGASPSICFYDINKTFISGTAYGGNSKITVISPVNCAFIRLTVVLSSIDSMQLELGSTASTYEPYSGTSVTIDLDGTRYGGTLDAVTGTLTVTHGIISDLSQLTWIQHGARTTAYYTTSNTLNLKTYNNMISSALKGVSASTTIGNMPDNSVRSDQSVDNYIYVNSTISSNVAAFTTSMSGVQLVYELATPTVITGLTPAQISLLLGENNVWADTGDTAVGYRADTKLYIDSKLAAAIAELQALILEH